MADDGLPLPATQAAAVAWAPDRGKVPEALVLTHLPGPQPTENHAFVSHGIPLALTRGDGGKPPDVGA